ncbi:hypothetical protein [Escherichia coli]|uniref:hypothetical protein n=1 Tax=Escherichia coli TaxID=562 RepID=UPI001C40247C|nr:hypothetical protein [Escherichia coli]
MEKYEIVRDDYIGDGDARLYRIRALRDIPRYGVKAGDVGGFIARYENLSQTDDAWVTDRAWVFDDAHVSGDAVVRDAARVSGNARVGGAVTVTGNARVCENALIGGDAVIFGNAVVSGRACVGGRARIYGLARCYGRVSIHGNAHIGGDVHVYGTAYIRGDAKIFAHHDWVYISRVSGAGYKGDAINDITAYRDVQGRIYIDSNLLSGPLDSPVVSQWLTGTVLSDVLNACMAEPVQENSD